MRRSGGEIWRALPSDSRNEPWMQSAMQAANIGLRGELCRTLLLVLASGDARRRIRALTFHCSGKQSQREDAAACNAGRARRRSQGLGRTLSGTPLRRATTDRRIRLPITRSCCGQTRPKHAKRRCLRYGDSVTPPSASRSPAHVTMRVALNHDQPVTLPPCASMPTSAPARPRSCPQRRPTRTAVRGGLESAPSRSLSADSPCLSTPSSAPPATINSIVC